MSGRLHELTGSELADFEVLRVIGNHRAQQWIPGAFGSTCQYPCLHNPTRWLEYQAMIKALDELLGYAHSYQRKALAIWNRYGKRREPAIFSGRLQVWKNDFHKHCQQILATNAHDVPRRGLAGMAQPSGYAP
jgi:hypothetical protein